MIYRLLPRLCTTIQISRGNILSCGIALPWHSCCSAVPVRRTCTLVKTWAVFGLGSKLGPSYLVAWVTWCLAPCCWTTPAQMTDRMEVEIHLIYSQSKNHFLIFCSFTFSVSVSINIVNSIIIPNKTYLTRYIWRHLLKESR